MNNGDRRFCAIRGQWVYNFCGHPQCTAPPERWDKSAQLHPAERLLLDYVVRRRGCRDDSALLQRYPEALESLLDRCCVGTLNEYVYPTPRGERT